MAVVTAVGGVLTIEGTLTLVAGPRTFPPPASTTAPTTLLATLTQAAAQPVLHQIHRLLLDGSKIYAAYGDYINNTGPTDIAALDLTDTADGFVTELVAETEEIWTLRLDGSTLYVPYMDPQGYDDPDVATYAVRSGGTWSTVRIPVASPVHAYDMLTTDDGLFLCGAGNLPESQTASVWFSDDGGATWSVSFNAEPTDSGLARAYALVGIAGAVLAFTRDGSGPTLVYKRDSGPADTWTVVDSGSIERVSDATCFDRGGATVALCIREGKSSGYPGTAPISVHALPADAAVRTATETALDGVTASDLAVTPDGTTAYLLDGMQVWRLGPTGAAVRLLDLDRSAVSIAVSADTAYLGTADSKVYSVPLADLEP